MAPFIRSVGLICFLSTTMAQVIELNLGGNIGTNQRFWNDVNGKGVYHSFGQGIEIGGKFLFPLQENLNVETGFQFLAGTKRTVKKGDEEYEFSSTLLSLPLGVHLQAGMGDLTLYSRFGALLGLITRANVIFNDFGNDPDLITESRYSKGISGGFYGSLGIQVPFGSDLYFFGEVGYQSLTWRPQELERISTVGTLSNKEIITLVKDNPADKEDFSPSLPFSAVKVHLGIGKSF